MTQVDGPTLIQMRREDAIEELQLSQEQASAMVDELGLLLGLDALDLNGEGSFSKRELVRGIGGNPDVAALFGLAQCDAKRLHQLFPDVRDDEVLSRAAWVPLVRSARTAEQQREAEFRRHEAEAASIEAAKKAAESAAAFAIAKLQEEFETRLLQQRLKSVQLQREMEELQEREMARVAAEAEEQKRQELARLAAEAAAEAMELRRLELAKAKADETLRRAAAEKAAKEEEARSHEVAALKEQVEALRKEITRHEALHRALEGRMKRELEAERDKMKPELEAELDKLQRKREAEREAELHKIKRDWDADRDRMKRQLEAERGRFDAELERTRGSALAERTELAQAAQSFSKVQEALECSEREVAELHARLARFRVPQAGVETQTEHADFDNWQAQLLALERALADERTETLALVARMQAAEQSLADASARLAEEQRASFNTQAALDDLRVELARGKGTAQIEKAALVDQVAQRNRDFADLEAKARMSDDCRGQLAAQLEELKAGQALRFQQLELRNSVALVVETLREDVFVGVLQAQSTSEIWDRTGRPGIPFMRIRKPNLCCNAFERRFE